MGFWRFILLIIGVVPMCMASDGPTLHEHEEEPQNADAITGGAQIELELGKNSGPHETQCGQFKYFKVVNTHACKDLKITVKQQAGEPNLYVGRDTNKYPTPQSLSWGSYNWGDDIITVKSWEPDFYIGTFYIAVHAYCGTDVSTSYTAAKYTIRAEEVTSKHPKTEDMYNKDTKFNIKAEKYKYYRFCAPDPCVNVSVAISHCMKPLDMGCYNKYGFPEVSVSPTEEQPSVKHRAWMLAESDIRSVKLSPADPDFNPGHFYIGVYGWCTPGDKCPDPKTCGLCAAINDMTILLSVTATQLTDQQCDDLMARRPKPVATASGQPTVWPALSCFFLTILVGLLLYRQQ